MRDKNRRQEPGGEETTPVTTAFVQKLESRSVKKKKMHPAASSIPIYLVPGPA